MTARDTLVRVGAALACVPGPAAWAGVALGVVDPHVGSYVMVVGVCLGFVLMLAGPWVGGDATPRQRLTDTLVLWTLMSAGAQLGWELPFSLLHRQLVGVTEHDTWAWLFWAYGVADSRYLIADPFVVVMEGFTSLVGGPIELYTVWLVSKGHLRAAARWAVLVGATQWYGDILYFGVEAFTGFAHINFDVFFDWALKFAFLNGIWLVMPVVQVWAALRVLDEPEGTA